MHGGCAEDMQRVCRWCAEGAQRECRGYRMVARCVEVDME